MAGFAPSRSWRRQAPDDGRRKAWANITWCLNDLLTRHGWDGEDHIPLGATAGEDFRAALWGEG